jgi:TolA-binding protein
MDERDRPAKETTMNKVTPLILTFTLTLLTGSLAYAMDGGMDGGMQPEYIAMRQDVLAMDNSMRQMEQSMKALQDPAQRQEALKTIDSQISSMRTHMKKMDTYAELNGDMTMSGSLRRLNKAMTSTEQGIGQNLQENGKAIPTVQDGVRRMRTALDEIRAGI